MNQNLLDTSLQSLSIVLLSFILICTSCDESSQINDQSNQLTIEQDYDNGVNLNFKTGNIFKNEKGLSSYARIDINSATISGDQMLSKCQMALEKIAHRNLTPLEAKKLKRIIYNESQGVRPNVFFLLLTTNSFWEIPFSDSDKQFINHSFGFTQDFNPDEFSFNFLFKLIEKQPDKDPLFPCDLKLDTYRCEVSLYISLKGGESKLNQNKYARLAFFTSDVGFNPLEDIQIDQ